MSAAEPLNSAVASAKPTAARALAMPLSIKLAAGFLALMVVVSILAPLIAPYDFATQNLARRLRPPVFWGANGPTRLAPITLGAISLAA